jgi:hypothetical protein
MVSLTSANDAASYSSFIVDWQGDVPCRVQRNLPHEDQMKNI